MTPCILVDIDGTIALKGDRDPYDHTTAMEDAVNWPVVNLVNILYESGGIGVFLVSARDEEFRDITEYWLYKHDILSYRMGLYMRPLDDIRKDHIIKLEIYETYIKPYYDVKYILDDRDRVVDMWRAQGLTCLQVANGAF